MNLVRPHAVIALAAAAALVVLVAGPAAAFTPDGTAVLTITSTDPAVEGASVIIGGECPANTTQADVKWEWTDGSGSHTNEGPVAFTPVTGFFGDEYYLNGVDRGTTVTFTLSCVNEVDVLATDAQDFTKPNFGQTLSIPATVATNADIIANVNCPTVGVNTFYVTQFVGSRTLTPSISLPYTGSGAYNLGTPASVGVVAGDNVDVRVTCREMGDGDVDPSYRIATYAAVAPADMVTPPTSGGTGGAALAGTGTELGWMSAAAGTMTMLGIFLLVWTRSRRSHA